MINGWMYMCKIYESEWRIEWFDGQFPKNNDLIKLGS